MKKVYTLKKSIAVFLTIASIICFSAFRAISAEVSGDHTEKQTQEEKADAEGEISAAARMEAMAAKGNLELRVDNETASFCVINKDTGKIWWSNPFDAGADPSAKGLFKMKLSSLISYNCLNAKDGQVYYNRTSYALSIRKNAFKIEKIKDGYRVAFSFPEDGVGILLEVVLGEGYVEARVPMDGVIDGEDKRVTGVTILPYFGAGGGNAQGFMLIPDGSGAIINYNNGKASSEKYLNEVYDRDPARANLMVPLHRETIRLPVYGINNNGEGVLAVINHGAAVASLAVNVSGQFTSYNTVYPEFQIASYDTYVIGQGWANKESTIYEKGKPRLDECGVRYYILDRDASDYVGMAHAYGRHLVREGGLKASGESKSFFMVDILGATRKIESLIGIPLEQTVPLTTFGEARKMLEDIGDAGIEGIVTRYEGWNTDGITMRMPGKANIIGVLGGRKGLEALTDFTSGKNIGLYMVFDPINFKRGSWLLSGFFNSAQSISGLPSQQYEYKTNTYLRDSERGPWYLVRHSRILPGIVKFLDSVSGLKVDGYSFDSLSSTIYSDFSKEGLGREQAVKLWQDALSMVHGKGKKLMVEQSNSYALPYADIACGIPEWSSGYDIADMQVPFYQIALRGMVPIAGSPINFSSNTRRAFLRAVETGSMLRYSWIYREASLLKDSGHMEYYGADYREWLKTAAGQYKEVQELYAEIDGMRIISHRRLKVDVYETVYENGVCVTVNYGSKEYMAGNLTVAPESFGVKYEGGK